VNHNIPIPFGIGIDVTCNAKFEERSMNMSLPKDVYKIQVRLVGEPFWADSTELPYAYSAELAAFHVRESNRVADGIVYRAVLVSHA